jgi:hypothetical protein
MTAGDAQRMSRQVRPGKGRVGPDAFTTRVVCDEGRSSRALSAPAVRKCWAPVAAYRESYGTTTALPTVVGRAGAAGELEPSMSEDERRAFERSVATLREAARGIGVSSAARASTRRGVA